MNSDSIVYVLERLGSNKAKNLGKNVQAACPLAPWKHGSGNDTGMKLGVKVTDGVSPANCFYPDCFHGTLMDLVDQVASHKIRAGEWELGGEEVSDIKAFILLAEETDEVTYDAEARVVMPIPPEVLALVGQGSPYWEGRGIDPETAKEWKLGEGGGRAFIPLLDRQGNVVMMKGRLLPGEDVDEFSGKADARQAKFRAFPPGGAKSGHLAGEHLLTKPVELMVVVESESDAALLNSWMREWKLNPAIADVFPFGAATDAVAVATMGGEFSDDQVNAIVSSLADNAEVAIGFDADHPGRLGTRKLVDALRRRIPRISEVEWERKDPSDQDDGAGGKLPLDQVKTDAWFALKNRQDWFLKRVLKGLTK